MIDLPDSIAVNTVWQYACFNAKIIAYRPTTNMGDDNGVGGDFDFDVSGIRRPDGIHDVSHPRAKRSTVKEFKSGGNKFQ